MAIPRPIADVDSETEYQTESETLESELPKKENRRLAATK